MCKEGNLSCKTEMVCMKGRKLTLGKVKTNDTYKVYCTIYMVASNWYTILDVNNLFTTNTIHEVVEQYLIVRAPQGLMAHRSKSTRILARNLHSFG